MYFSENLNFCCVRSFVWFESYPRLPIRTFLLRYIIARKSLVSILKTRGQLRHARQGDRQGSMRTESKRACKIEGTEFNTKKKMLWRLSQNSQDTTSLTKRGFHQKYSNHKYSI